VIAKSVDSEGIIDISLRETVLNMDIKPRNLPSDFVVVNGGRTCCDQEIDSTADSALCFCLYPLIHSGESQMRRLCDWTRGWAVWS
jgi:hypothetical protein